MPNSFTYEKQRSYPHMGPRDVEIWERFISKYPNMYDMVKYDFRVGDVPQFSAEAGDIMDDNQHMLYQLRIDVVAFNGKYIDIIEVKPNAGPSSIGQVQGYRTLYLRDELPAEPVNTVIITDIERPNMRFLCEQAGTSLFVV